MTTATIGKFVIGNCIGSHLVISTKHVPKDAGFYGLCILSKADDDSVSIRTTTPTMDAVTIVSPTSMSVEGLSDGKFICADAASLSRAIDSFGMNTNLDIVIAASGSEMLVRLADSDDDSQTVPLTTSQNQPQKVQCPERGVGFTCSIGALFDALSRIKFSLPVSEVAKHYTYIKTRIFDNSVQLVAGNGQCFARTSFVCAESKLSEASKAVFLPSKDLMKIADYLINNFDSEDHVTVTFIKDRIGFVCDNFRAVVSSGGSSITWPEENDIFSRESSTVLSADMPEWNSVHSGIKAVFDLENDPNSLCRTKLGLSSGGKKAVVATGSRNVSRRTVSLRNESKIGNSSASGTFGSRIFCEIVKAAKSASWMTFEMDANQFRGMPSPIIMRAFDDASESPLLETFFSQFP